MAIDHDTLIELATPAIAKAADFAGRREALIVERKTRGDFVSEADRDVEALICASLRGRFGNVALLGEEGGGSLDADGSGWAIDPIDGTTNFLRGLPLWGVSLGYVDRMEPVAGLIALPDLALTLTAVRGGGVRRNGILFKRPPVASDVRLLALGENDYEAGTMVDARAERWRRKDYGVVRYGCATISIAAAVFGWTDGYIERGCSLWDIAAGAIIGREAGLRVEMGEIAPGRWAFEALDPTV